MMRISRIKVALLILGLGILFSALAQTSVTLLGHTITYEGRVFDGTNTTFTYKLTTGSGPGLKDVSHWDVGLGTGCTFSNVVGSSGTKVDPDPTTGIVGYKYDQETKKGGHTSTITVTYSGDVPDTGTVTVGLKAGQEVATGTLKGPNCATPPPTRTLTVTASPVAAQGGTFTLTVNSGSCSPGSGSYTTPMTFTCDNNSQVTVSNPQSPVPSSPTDTRYVFSSFSPSASVTLDADKTITLNYTTQFLVSYAVSGCNGLTVTPPATEWVNAGGTATGSFPAQVTEGGTRCNFLNDNRPATITGPTTVTGSYQTQFLVSYTASGCTLSVAVPAEEWVNAGGAATGNFPAQVASNGTRCNFVSDNRPATITAPTTITGSYQTQFKVSYAASGCSLTIAVPADEWVNAGGNAVGSFPASVTNTDTRCQLVGQDPAGPINAPTIRQGTYKTQFLVKNQVTGCGLSMPVPAEEWVDAGGYATSFPAEVTSGDTRCQLIDQDPTGPINGPTARTGTYKTQFRVTFDQSGANAPAQVTVNGVPKTIVYTDWFDAGVTISYAYESPISGGPGTRFVCQSNCSGTLTMDNPQSVQAVYGTQYFLTVNNGGYGTASGQDWYNAGATANFSISPTTVQVSSNERVNFTGWSGDSTSPNASASILMDAPKTVTATWSTQFLVTYAVTGCSLSITPPASEWVNSGGNATGSFPNLVMDTDTRCILVSADPSGPINAPTTRTGTYKTQFLVQYAQSGCDLSVPLPAAEWVDKNGYAIGNFPASVTDTGTRCQLQSYDPSGPITAPTTRHGKYQTQFLVQYAQTGCQLAISLPASEWVDAGGSAMGEFPATVTDTGTRCLFQGDDRPKQITEPVTVTATYQTQYQVSFTQIGASGTVNVQFDGTHPVPFSAFLNAGSILGSFQYDPIVGKYFCQSSCSSTIGLLTGPLTITAVYALDDVPPRLTCAPLTPPNMNGWNNTDVAVLFVADDEGSGLAEADGTPLSGIAHFEFTKTITGEGANLSVSATVKDRVGNVATATCTANIDKTPPTISVNVMPSPDSSGLILTEGTVSVEFTCTDPPNASNGTPASGIASCSPPIMLIAEGAHTISGQAVDRAGNIAVIVRTLLVARPATRMIIQVKIKDEEIPPPGEEMTVELILKFIPDGLRFYDLLFRVEDPIARIESITSKTIHPKDFKVLEKQDFFVRFEATDSEDKIKPGDANVVFAELKLRNLLPGRSLLVLVAPGATVINDKGQVVESRNLLLIPAEFEIKPK